MSPRVFRLVVLPAPSDREKTKMYLQRYMQYFPAAGEIVTEARTTALVGFRTKEQHGKFLKLCPIAEKYMVGGGIILIKILDGSREEGATAPI